MIVNGTELVLEGIKVIQAGTFSNFSGGPTQWDRNGGRRYFTLELPLELAEQMKDDGWNVKIRDPYREGDEATGQLKVNFGWNPSYPRLDPNIVMIKGGYPYPCTEATVGELDHEDIDYVDLKIRAWRHLDQRTGEDVITAYCSKMFVNVKESQLDAKYRSVMAKLSSQADDEVPFDVE